MTTPRTYTADEAATILGTPPRTLRDQAAQGRIPHLHPFQVGKRWYFPRRLVDQLADGNAA